MLMDEPGSAKQSKASLHPPDSLQMFLRVPPSSQPGGPFLAASHRFEVRS